MALLGIVLLCATAALAYVFQQNRKAPMASGPQAIAILPFADLSAAHDNQVFCDGLTEELLNALAHVNGLRVIARTSAFALRDGAADVRDVGTRLGVSHVLEGSVRRDGDRVRVTAQLVSVKDGFQVWSNSFDRPYRDVLTIQESIAKDVVRVLEVKLSADASQRVGTPPTPDISAYELYLLGRFQQQQRTPEAIERAIAYEQQAIALDPNFALAYAGIADAHMTRVFYSNRELADEAPAVEQAVAKALQINPQSAEAYAARAVLHTERWESDAAIADLQRAVAIQPNFADAYVRLGAAYEYRGEPIAALRNYDIAAQLDPLHVQMHIRRCLTLQNMGRYAEARAACERANTLKPNNANTLWTFGLIELSQGHLVEAIDGYRNALAQTPQRSDLLAQLGWLYLDLGLVEEARATLDRGVEFGPQILASKLDRARLFLLTRDVAALRLYLKTLDLPHLQDADDLLDAALLELLVGDTVAAAELQARAQHAADYREEKVFNNVWSTRWGRSDAMTMACIALARGDREAMLHYTSLQLKWVDRLVRNGQLWHGAEYLRGAALALRGDADSAMAALRRAYAQGFRRGWWLLNDPALASLRPREDFVKLARQIADDDARMRAQLAAR